MQPHYPTRGDIEELLLAAQSYPPEVAERLKWFLCFLDTNSVSETCRRFGIARTTFYRWSRRFDANDLTSLQDPVIATPQRIFQQYSGREDSVVSAEPLSPDAASAALPAGEIPFAAEPSGPALLTRAWNRIRRPLIVTSLVVQILLLVGFVGTAVLEAHTAQSSVEAQHEYETLRRQQRLEDECRQFLVELRNAKTQSLSQALSADDEHMRAVCEQVLRIQTTDPMTPHTNP